MKYKRYRFRVTLPNIKGFFRVYEMKPETSLYAFHRQMGTDMSFPQDQLVLFKAVDPLGTALARYRTFDMGNGTIDAVTVAKAVAAGHTSFVYFYDTTNKKSVLVNFEDVFETETPATGIRLIDVKGPDPIEFENGYVAFEDLPQDKQKTFLPADDKEDNDDFDDDDLDDDLDDEDEDDDINYEDGKEIFSEDE